MVQTVVGTPETQTTASSNARKAVFCGKEVPLNELVSFKLTDEDIFICDANREAILDLIAGTDDFLKVPEEKRNSFYEKMRNDINWHWKTAAGRLTKVIDNHMFKNYGVSLGESLLTKIGDVALKDTPLSKEYRFDITDSLKWRSGDFGDHESCFLNPDGSSTTSTKVMQESGDFYALRFFKSFGAAETQDPQELENNFPGIHYVKDGELYLGIARSWIYNPEPDKIAVFNGYGYTTSSQADLFGRYLGVEKTYNNVSSPLHVNGMGAYTLGNNLGKDKLVRRIPGSMSSMGYELYDDDWD